MRKITPTATYDDVNLILRLYELRREPRLREARAWFTKNFHVNNWEEAQALTPPGTEANASMRMVCSYWDMVASFITSGVLKADLFYESGRELLLVWVRVEPVLESLRTAFKDPYVYHNLETVGREYAEWMKQRSPESYEAFSSRIKNMR